MSEENQPVQTPLIERLESVPKDARQMLEVGPCHHRNIPYGRYCHEAAARIRELEKLTENACDECDGTGWKFNRVEGRHPCVCMEEAEPYQLLQAEIERLLKSK